MPAKKRQGLSQRAYAEHRGVSHTAVQQAVRTERIPTFPDGSIDRAAADRAWAVNTDESKPDNSVSGRTARRGAKSAAETSSSPEGTGEPHQAGGWQKNRTAREGYAALLMKLRYETQTGENVKLEDVRQANFAMAKKLQGAALAMPEQLASEGVMKSRDELYAILDDWAIKFCEEMQAPVERQP